MQGSLILGDLNKPLTLILSSINYYVFVDCCHYNFSELIVFHSNSLFYFVSLGRLASEKSFLASVSLSLQQIKGISRICDVLSALCQATISPF